MDDIVLLDAPTTDSDIDDVLYATESPNPCPSSTLGLSLPTNTFNTNTNVDTNNLTSSLPVDSPSDVHDSVFHNPPVVRNLPQFHNPSNAPNAPSIRPPPGIPFPSSTLGLTIPPPPGFPIQVDNIQYFPLWIPMATSIPNSSNLHEIAMHQAAYMNFNNLQHVSLSDPTTLSVSEVQPEFKLPAPFHYQRDSLPATQETTVQELDKLPDLSPTEARSFLLSLLGTYRDQELQSKQLFDIKFLQTRFKGGIREVQGAKDPLSNMWTGPVHFQGQMWPTREHAIVAVKLERTSYLGKEKIRELVLDCKDGFQAKRVGKRYSNHNQIGFWHSVRRSTVFDILISAAFTDAQFLSCLLDPQIKEFHHVLPSGYRDPYWATPGENIHGKLLAGVRKSIITVATQLHHFLHHPYVITDLNHIYLGQGVSLDMIPSIAGAIHLLYYPPPPIKQSALQSPPLKRPRYIQEAPECTDVRLRDNPTLAEEWKPKTKEPLPSRPNKSITPLLQIETACPITPEISNSTSNRSVTPLLDLDIAPVPTSEVSVAPMYINENASCNPVPSLLDMQLQATRTRVQEVANTFTSTSSAQIHRKYFCPLCEEPVNRIKSHVVEIHLPYYVNVEAACFLCEHNYGTANNLSNHIQAKHSDRHGNIDHGASLATTYIENKYLHLITYFLNYLAKMLEVSTVSDLLSTFHNSPEAMPKSTWATWLQWYEMKPTATEQYLMGQLSKFLHVTMPEEVQLMPPNTIVALLHWRPITALIKMLPPE